MQKNVWISCMQALHEFKIGEMIFSTFTIEFRRITSIQRPT